MDLPALRPHAPKVAVGLLLLTGLLAASAAVFQGLEPAATSIRVHQERLAIGQPSQAPDLGAHLPVILLGSAAAAASWAGAVRALKRPGDLVSYGGAFLGLLVFPLVTPFAALALAAVAVASEEPAPDLEVRRWFPVVAGVMLLLTSVAAIASAYNQTGSALALVPPFDQGWAITLVSLAALGGAVVGAVKALAGSDLHGALGGSVVALLAYPLGTVPALLAVALLYASVREGALEADAEARAPADDAEPNQKQAA